MGLKTTSLWILLLLIAPPWILTAQALSSVTELDKVAQQNRLLAEIYVDQARSAFDQGDYSTMGHLLRVAEEFDSSSSDVPYLMGQMFERMGSHISDAISSYRTALNRDRWDRFTAEAAKLKLAPLLIRVKQFRSAARVLQGMGTTSADYLFYNCEALIGEGLEFQARNLLSQAEQAYPLDGRFSELRIRIDPAYRADLASRFIQEPQAARFTKPVAEALIQNLSGATQKMSAISAFDKRFGSTPRIFAQSLLASTSVTTAQIDVYIADGLLSDGKLSEAIYAHLSPGPVKDYLGSKLTSFTGKVTFDANGDGIPEETASYSAGAIDQLEVDADQDAVPEYNISFANGIPAKATIMVNGVAYHITYSTYPFLESASFEMSGQDTVYTLEPGRVSFPLFGSRAEVPSGPQNFPPIVKAPHAIGKQELFAFASQVAVTNAAKNTPISLWKKSLDDILILEQDWNGGQYAYKAVYHHGEKFSAEIDLDNDGYYEVHEFYHDGKLNRLTYDGDHNAVPEFTLELTPYPTLSWDFNQDGLIDEVEKKTSANTTVLEFSSKMNGVFDVITKEVTK